MLLKYKNYADLATEIKENSKKIVVYGAGMIGKILVPYIIEEYDLLDNLIFFIDANKRIQGNVINISDREYEIKSPESLCKLPKGTVIFVSNSNYHPIVKMMDDMSELDKVDCYIIPILQVINTRGMAEKCTLRRSENQLIPKKIHYCWFSRNPIPDYLQRCIESWKKYCPDYEIIRWDESNYDITKNVYMKQAYDMHKWGFVPDIARLDILYNHGGIYIDTDVELIRNLDELLYQPAFTGVEKWGSVNTGGGSGASKHNPIIKKMLDFRINEKFILEDGSLNQMTCGYYETVPLIELGMKPNNSIQILDEITVYSHDFFHPYDYMSGETTITANTFSIHHFNGGWINDKGIEERRRTRNAYKKILSRMGVPQNVQER